MVLTVVARLKHYNCIVVLFILMQRNVQILNLYFTHPELSHTSFFVKTFNIFFWLWL